MSEKADEEEVPKFYRYDIESSQRRQSFQHQTASTAFAAAISLEAFE